MPDEEFTREDLEYKSEIWLRPKQGGHFVYDFDDVINANDYEFRLVANERKWPFGGKDWSELKSHEWTPGDSIFSVDGTDSSLLYIDIPQSKIESWDHTTMKLSLYANDTTDSNGEWHLKDFTVTVEQGR